MILLPLYVLSCSYIRLPSAGLAAYQIIWKHQETSGGSSRLLIGDGTGTTPFGVPEWGEGWALVDTLSHGPLQLCGPRKAQCYEPTAAVLLTVSAQAGEPKRVAASLLIVPHLALPCSRVKKWFSLA